MNSMSELFLRDEFAEERRKMNECRFMHHAEGHYESYFLRANHPSRPIAFWIRYTIFAPKGRPQDNLGELWAVVFNGETNNIIAVKEEFPLSHCQFDNSCLNVNIAGATLRPGAMIGEAKNHSDKISWDLAYSPGDKPIRLLPEALYEGPFPKAKALVANPNCVFNGHILINGDAMPVENWVGSENHNWGSKHTDEYAWGQVAGFDNDPEAFLECATARIKLGPVKTPWMTTLVLRVDGETYELNSLLKAPLAKASYRYFHWNFETSNKLISVRGEIKAPKAYFVGLTYGNPPGGTHTCLNSKLASCSLSFKVKGNPPRVLETQNRAAFEILTDDFGHGVPVVV